jgi:3-ketosteroid 9alpha-monooxygenase subunit A
VKPGDAVGLGWYQIAFERDLHEGVNEIAAWRPLMALRTRKGLRVFDATCPHRGANLAWGGCPDGDSIRCPFHDRRIGLGADMGSGYQVREYPVLTVGGMVFACFSERHEHGFRALMQQLDRDHYFVAGFATPARVAAELVIENGFDCTHFGPVHSVLGGPGMQARSSEHGEFSAQGTFLLPASPWQQTSEEQGRVAVPYRARAFSAGIVVSEMGGADPYWVITTAMPTAEHECIIRLSIAVPAGADGAAPNAERCSYLIHQCKLGIESDLVVWEHLQPAFAARYAPEDRVVVQFRKFLSGLHGAA